MRLMFKICMGLVLAVLVACGGTPTSTPTPAAVPPTAVPATAAPTAGLVTATPEPANVAPTATAEPQGIATGVAPAATSVPVAPVAPDSKLVGSYSGILPAADAPGRIVTLELARDGSATMTTQFIGKGGPSVESGTWSEQDNTADVTLTQKDGAAQDNRITWTLQGTNLVATKFDPAQYGTAGLALSRVGNGDVIESNFNGVSFSFDSALAQSAQGTVLAARPVEQAPALGGAAPQGIQFTFNNQNLPDYFDPTKAQVYVYPVDGLNKLDQGVAQNVQALQTILADGTVEGDESIPVFPLIPASQVFHAQAHVIDFVNGTGISFITYYAQDVAPLRPEQVFWTFQGITLDNQFYVSVFMPIGSPALPPAQDISGADYDAFAKNYKTYLNNIVTTLNSLPAAGFTPNLSLLENMARSINAAPVFPEPAAPATSAPQATATGAQAEATPVPANGQTVAAAHDNVSFSFDKGLAQSAQGVDIAAVPVSLNAPMLGGGVPKHIAFAFNGEQITADVNPFQAQVRVYPLADLKGLDSSVADEVAKLKALLVAQPAEPAENVPVFPLFNAAQVMHSNVAYLQFANGKGVRFVTFYAQDVAPITNDGLFYTFQGLTTDEKYYVTVFWASKTDKLPNSYQDAKITDYGAWAKQFETYRTDTINMLNGLPPEAYVPNLSLLDQLVQSISIPN